MRLRITARIDGIYQFLLGEFQTDGTMENITSIITRCELHGEPAEILIHALAERRPHSVHIEVTLQK